jgi:hypothetical protein
VTNVSHKGEECLSIAPELAERLAAAREHLRDAVPGLQERPEPGRQPRFAYTTGSCAPLFRLVVDPPNLFLHFADGAALSDPAGLLRGAGRRGRYVCLRNHAIGTDAGIRALIDQAMVMARTAG